MSELASSGYSGTDNLEVMEAARRYNAFLCGLVADRARPGDRILDFGAGAGTLARPLCATGWQVDCVEPDRALRDRLTAAGLNARAELPGERYPLIYTFNVLEHIADDAGTVTALGERLAPGGCLLVYVPAFALLFTSMDARVGHLRRYRRRALTALVERAGLRLETAAYCDCLGFFATLLFKFAGNDRGAINQRALIAYDRWVFPLSRLLDRAAGRWFGKNLLVVARRDG